MVWDEEDRLEEERRIHEEAEAAAREKARERQAFLDQEREREEREARNRLERRKRARHRKGSPRERDGGGRRRRALGPKSYLNALLIVKTHRGMRKMIKVVLEVLAVVVIVLVALFFINKNGDDWAERYRVESTVDLPDVVVEPPDESLVIATITEIPSMTAAYTWEPAEMSSNITFFYPDTWEPQEENKVVSEKNLTYTKTFINPNLEDLTITYRKPLNGKVSEVGLEKFMLRLAKGWDLGSIKEIEGKYGMSRQVEGTHPDSPLNRVISAHLVQDGYVVVSVTQQNDPELSELSEGTAAEIASTVLIEER